MVLVLNNMVSGGNAYKDKTDLQVCLTNNRGRLRRDSNVRGVCLCDARGATAPARCGCYHWEDKKPTTTFVLKNRKHCRGSKLTHCQREAGWPERELFYLEEREDGHSW